MAKKKILIIEDEQGMIDSLIILLKSEYEVESANNGREGLEKVAAFKPDLVILDLLMPEKNGFDVCKTLKAGDSTRNIPVIALSCFAELHEMSFADDLGKVSLPSEVYLSKPFDPDTLLREVRQFIG